MKKMLYFFLLIQCTVFATQKEVCVVPVYQDAKTGQWQGLFVKQTENLWAFIRTLCDMNQSDEKVAYTIFNHYTNHRLTIDFETFKKTAIKKIIDETTVLFYVPIKYEPANNFTLTQNNKPSLNGIQYHWANLGELSKRRTLTKIIHGKAYSYQFDRKVCNVLKNVPMVYQIS